MLSSPPPPPLSSVRDDGAGRPTRCCTGFGRARRTLRSKAPRRPSSAHVMRTAADREYKPLQSPPLECSAINRLQLMEYEYHSALSDLEQEQISFSIFSDVCLPVSLLILVVIWGYQLNAMSLDPDSGDNHTMMFVYGIGLIVISGTVCVYIAIRMAAMRPEKVSTFLSDEMKPFFKEEKRSQWYYYQTIPEIHKSYKKPTKIFIV